MGEMHQIKFGVIEFIEKNRLFLQGVMRCIDENFVNSGVWRGESFKFGAVEEENVLILAINLKKMIGQLMGIATNAGKTGGIHSAIDADAHEIGLKFRELRS